VFGEITALGFAFVDNPHAISGSLVREIRSKAKALRISYPFPTGHSGLFGYGQGGFIRQDPAHTSPGGTKAARYSVIPITAKHNLRCVTLGDSDRDVSFSEHDLVPDRVHLNYTGEFVNVVSADLGWKPTREDVYNLRDGVEGKPTLGHYGLDISVAATPVSDSYSIACKSESSCSRVDDSFTPAKGQKVGMAVVVEEGFKPTKKKTIVGAFETEVELSEAEIEKIYGKPGMVNIYTGEITYVGPQHIEYTINAFTGCAGAIVFLLDVDQPDSVDTVLVSLAKLLQSTVVPILQLVTETMAFDQ